MFKKIKNFFITLYYGALDKGLMFLSFLRQLFYDGENPSLGRTCFIFIFALGNYFWIVKNISPKVTNMVDLPPGMLKVIMFLLAYNVVKLPVQAGLKYIEFKIDSLKSNSSSVDNDQPPDGEA